MNDNLALDVEDAAAIKSHLVSAGFSRYDVDRLADGSGLWMQILMLVTGEGRVMPVDFTVESLGGPAPHVLARRGKDLTLDGQPLVLVRCKDVATNYAELRANYKPEDLPPPSVAKFLEKNPHMLPSSWRSEGGEKWITFLTMFDSDNSAVSGLYMGGDSPPTTLARWGGDGDDDFETNEFVVIIGKQK